MELTAWPNGSSRWPRRHADPPERSGSVPFAVNVPWQTEDGRVMLELSRFVPI